MERIFNIVALAQAHVSEGERRVEEQRERVAALRRDGHDTKQAEQLLATFEAVVESMRSHLEHEQKSTGHPDSANR